MLSEKLITMISGVITSWRHGSAVAVVWTLAWPDVSGAIVGGRLPQQVDGWMAPHPSN
jgi:hypothetical protein